MDVFSLRESLVDQYASFARSFTKIRASDIREQVAAEYEAGRFWPDPLIQINPRYRPGRWVADLVAEGMLHPTCGELFGVRLYLKYFTKKQMCMLPPERYSEVDTAFIVPRVLELTYTAEDLRPWASDLDYDGPPFPWDPERRAMLRAELDAYYARLYGLTRDEPSLHPRPGGCHGTGLPAKTFRVLKNNEERQYGEYRTRRLVLEAWDRLEREGWTSQAALVSA